MCRRRWWWWRWGRKKGEKRDQSGLFDLLCSNPIQRLLTDGQTDCSGQERDGGGTHTWEEGKVDVGSSMGRKDESRRGGGREWVWWRLEGVGGEEDKRRRKKEWGEWKRVSSSEWMEDREWWGQKGSSRSEVQQRCRGLQSGGCRPGGGVRSFVRSSSSSSSTDCSCSSHWETGDRFSFVCSSPLVTCTLQRVFVSFVPFVPKVCLSLSLCK